MTLKVDDEKKRKKDEKDKKKGGCCGWNDCLIHVDNIIWWRISHLITV